MKRWISLAIVLVILFTSSLAFCEAIILSSSKFTRTAVTVSADNSVSFYATASLKCSYIKVSSCYLQKYNGSTWENSKTLSCPSSVSDTTFYSAKMQYSFSLSQGVQYRILATFEADGESVNKASTTFTP